MKKRALVVGVGAMRGSYDGGVLYELLQAVGSNHFSHIFASSVGAYNASFFATGQFGAIEEIWKNHVHGLKLINPLNPLRGRKILDLEYLSRLLQSHGTALDLERLFTSPVQLRYVATNVESVAPVYLAPSREHLFDQLRASAALPIIHGPVSLPDGNSYTDAAFTAPLPLEPAVNGDFDEIIVVYNKPKGFYTGWEFNLLSPFARYFVHDNLVSLATDLPMTFKKIEERVEQSPNIKVIRPSLQLPVRSILDSSREHLVASFEMGRRDARTFLRGYKP